MIKKFGKENFSFDVFTKYAVENSIKNLPTSKASVSNDIPVSIMKETFDAYCPKLTQIMNHCLKNNFLLIYQKMLKWLPVLKKKIRVEKKILDQLASCQIFQRFLRG